ncbi:gene transfer agent family protein [uncultured Enterovirga sp.]|uniref:gene transfer agent family protein n=1 Tax=uncultured Enterovirga sp. TaxID=2026352 RepID=UPI0035CBDE57
MSSDGSITLLWGDGEHRFRLAIGQLRELQTKCNAGPLEILDRLANRTWRIDDARETIRLGLIGGGMEPIAALERVLNYVDARPPMESLQTAQAVLIAAIIGVPDDPVGQGKAEGEATAGSSSQPFTAVAQPSAGPPDRSMN